MDGIFEMILMGFVALIGIEFLFVILHYSRKRGEDCPRYPYDCTFCRHAAECIIMIGRKKDDA